VIAVALALLAAAVGCALERQEPLAMPDAALAPAHYEGDAFVSFDGARLPLTVWAPDPELFPEPWAVIVAVHGVSEYSDAWWLAGPWWAEQGIKVYAFDQRGFGRAPGHGIWAGADLMAADVIAAAAAARAAHPDARLAVVGQSMGAAVVLHALARSPTPLADRVVISAPGVRGWSALPWTYRVSLWTAAHVAPRWAARPPRGIKIYASDNMEALYRNGRDPLFIHDMRMDMLYGLVSLMEQASKAEPVAETPLLLIYGENDQLIPRRPVEALAARLACARTALYPEGWHMLFRDLQAETVWRDVESFLRDADAPLPSGAPPITERAGDAACPAEAPAGLAAE
jgi:alpha-beta hydrolase superfamily lysophospholipase